MVAIRFDDAPFTKSHGQAPRGRGSWAFQIESMSNIHFSPSMTLAEARSWIRAKAKATVVPNLHKDVTEIWINILP